MPDIVNAVLVGSQGVLLGRRSPDRRAYPNRWSFPGGHVEAGESFERALQREIQEELGLTLHSFSFLTTIEIASPAASFHLFTVTAWDGRPAIRDRGHTELRWFMPEEACALDDLALEEYRPLFHKLGGMAASR
ncbi:MULTISPECIES: NUDIX domain-containing protein [Brucella/Ochrobactrum group]|uniref:NUDIX domain-containing protein n=1 Tax=Brucella/Ochrobactrum group TaxID=2826938 RepID=UPI000F659451|nr:MULTISPECIES: NUDIX domain-containing protein [Brucella/Ochrobactrum group]MCQ9144755.1 NUDIX domain-containing protein [Ochrobactrum sp. BTU2]RRY17322.1 NUDIX domain-containing protein [Brucella anthropi]